MYFLHHHYKKKKRKEKVDNLRIVVFEYILRVAYLYCYRKITTEKDPLRIIWVK